MAPGPFRRMRELMNTPFARPPGRRSLWARFAPEWCALGVYAVVAGVLVWHRLTRREFHEALFRAVVGGYGLAGLLLVVMPVGLLAVTLSGERQRGTAEAVVLGAHDHAAQAWGRFLRLTLPWLRLLLYLLPIYAVLSSNYLVGEGGRVGDWVANIAICAFAPKPIVLLLGWAFADYLGDLHWSALCLPVGAIRVFNDLSILAFASSLAFLLSARCRRSLHSLVLSYALIPLVLLTIMSLDSWWFLLQAGSKFFAVGEAGMIVVYVSLCIGLLLLRLAAAYLMVRSVARNFDRYALGERAQA